MLYAPPARRFLCKDYITFRLTGSRTSDVSDMSGCGLLRLPERRLRRRLLAAYGLADAARSCPISGEPTEVAGARHRRGGEATGLAAGTPVVAGLFDVVANA
jgi:L-xylulokinase